MIGLSTDQEVISPVITFVEIDVVDALSFFEAAAERLFCNLSVDSNSAFSLGIE